MQFRLLLLCSCALSIISARAVAEEKSYKAVPNNARKLKCDIHTAARKAVLAASRKAKDIIDFTAEDFNVQEATPKIIAHIKANFINVDESDCVISSIFSKVIAAHRTLLEKHPLLQNAKFKGFEEASEVTIADITGVKSTPTCSARGLAIKVCASDIIVEMLLCLACNVFNAWCMLQTMTLAGAVFIYAWAISTCNYSCPFSHHVLLSHALTGSDGNGTGGR